MKLKSNVFKIYGNNCIILMMHVREGDKGKMCKLDNIKKM